MRAIAGRYGLNLLAALCLGSGFANAEDKVTVRVVKYSGLADTIKKFKGQVIVVDVWAYW